MSDDAQEERGADKPPRHYVSDAGLRQAIEESVEGALAETLASADFPAIWQMLKTHDKILRGNGRPGLVEDIAVLRPLAGELHEHLKNFQKFETENKLDRQSIFAKLETLSTDMAKGFTNIFTRLKPVEETSSGYFKTLVAVGTVSAIVGAVLTFLMTHWDKVKGIFQ